MYVCTTTPTRKCDEITSATLGRREGGEDTMKKDKRGKLLFEFCHRSASRISSSSSWFSSGGAGPTPSSSAGATAAFAPAHTRGIICGKSNENETVSWIRLRHSSRNNGGKCGKEDEAQAAVMMRCGRCKLSTRYQNTTTQHEKPLLG